MDDILRKPYEISVWSDEPHYILTDGTDTTDVTQGVIVNDYIKEIKVGVIGSNTMDTPIKAFNPHLVSNVNGSHTLTFELFSKYSDETGELVQNPWYAYLAPERKVKLKYDGEWYDFIITQRQDTSDKYGVKITCTDLFISELSKNGFNIELKTELYNNQGTADELATEILKETNWRVAPVGDDPIHSDVIKQYNNEAVFVYGLPGAITATAMEDGSTASIPAGDTIYICYSSLANNETLTQFFWNADGTYVLSDDGTILNSLHYEVLHTDIEGATINSCNISTQYRGDKLVRKQLSKYIPALDKVCLEYKDANDNIYYIYSETEATSSANIQQLITNNQNFISTDGWSCAGLSILSVEDDNLLKITWGNNSEDITENPIINSGLYDNRAWFQKGWITGEQLCLLVKYPDNNPSALTSVKLHLYTVEQEGTPIYTINGTYGGSYNGYIMYNFGNASYVGGQVLPNISYDELVAYSNIDIELQGAANTTTYIEDIQLFKCMWDDQNRLILPSYEAAHDEVLRTSWYVFTKEAVDSATDESHLTYYRFYYNTLGDNYIPVYSQDYAKIRSIEGEKSNCFNLLQEICETFECWIKFYIQHDALGYVHYSYQNTTDTKAVIGKRYYEVNDQNTNTDTNNIDSQYKIHIFDTAQTIDPTNYYEKVYDKYVQILEYISTDNYSGFRRGINLKSTSRTSTSTNIVTKLIVEPNSNQFADNGFCSIQLSDMNQYGENVLFNFDYYINQKLLDKTALYRDLYHSNVDTNGIELLYKLHQLNQGSQHWIVNEQVYGKLVVTLEARVQSLKALVAQNDTLCNTNRQYYLEEGYIESNTPDRENHLHVPPANWPPSNPANIPLPSTDPTSDWSVPQSVYDWCVARNQYYRRQAYYEGQLQGAQDTYNNYLAIYNEALDNLKAIAERKTALYREFYSTYGRFIKEGSWISEDYQDPDLYYLDALGVLYNSAFPKVEYNFSVIDVAALPEYKGYTFRIGDKTYIEDTEFFGWGDNGMPYRQEVIISQLDQSLDNPSQNKITVQNYKDRFDDLFQRITASTQSLQYAEGGYARAAAAITTDGRIDTALMNRALRENASVITNVADQSVVWDNQGITISSPFATNEIVRLVNGGIVLTNDAGKTWTTGITAEGINAKAITTGVLNTDLIRIYNGTKPSFLWDKDGIIAYGTIPNTGAVVNSQFVKFNGDGIVGYKNADSQNAQPVFKLTYEGFELNALNDGNDFVRIGTGLANIDNKKPIIQGGSGNQNNFIVYSDGTVYANNGVFNGRIEAESGYFKGELRAATGTFTGTLKANDILLGNDTSGWNSILEGQKIKNNYLDLGNIQIDGNNTTISLGNGGVISIGGALSISASGITWNNQSTSGLSSTAFNGQVDWSNVTGNKPSQYYPPSYIHETYIGATEIQSPRIVGGELYASDSDSYIKINGDELNYYSRVGSSNNFTRDWFLGTIYMSQYLIDAVTLGAIFTNICLSTSDDIILQANRLILDDKIYGSSAPSSATGTTGAIYFQYI